MPETPTLHLAPGRDASLRRRHPWVFGGAVRSVSGEPAPGDTVAVADDKGRFLAWAAYSPTSQIAARVWSFDQDDVVDDAFIGAKVERAAALRSGLGAEGPTAATNACRLVSAESDGLPGVVADRYGSTVVVQLTSAGADRWRDAVVGALFGLPGVDGVLERSDVDVRNLEGLEARTGTVAGDVPDTAEVTERSWSDPAGAPWRFEADLRHGHKTGFYLDQRHNRQVVASLAEGRRTLDLFCYSGGFGVAATAGGAAEVRGVDSSGPALALAAHNRGLNGMEEATFVEANVFTYLRELRDRGEQYDLVIADPPKLARSAKQLSKATRAYKDLNLLALKLLSPGGVLVTFSCSGAVSGDLFQKVLFGAALDADREVQVLDRLTQPADHPVLLSFPEGWYLKGLVLRAA